MPSAWLRFHLLSVLKYPDMAEEARERKDEANVENALFDNVSFGN